MLRRQAKAQPRRENRYYERLSLEQQAPNERIPPYKYLRPSTIPLGIEPTEPTDDDVNKSTGNIYNTTYASTNNNDTSDDSTSSSLSVYTIKLYNRLEGRWENRRPNPFHHETKFINFQADEETRLTAEPHPTHDTSKRAFYVEYHRQRIYTNDTDSAFDASSSNQSDLDTTVDIYDSTESNDSVSSVDTTITWQSRRRLHWKNRNYTEGNSIELEFDSDGDFPLHQYTSSTTTSTHHSQSRSVGYNTQDVEDNNYYAQQGRKIYAEHHPSESDNEFHEYYRYSTSNVQPSTIKSTNSRNNTIPETRVTSTTTRVTTTETGTPHTNPLPTLDSRYNLPLRAARKSVHPVYAVPRPAPTYTRLRSSKQVARKSTVTQKERTITQKVAVAPDTTTSSAQPTKTVQKRKRVWENYTPPSDSDTDIPYTPRFKRDPNA
jgi:hypothetical protein